MTTLDEFVEQLVHDVALAGSKGIAGEALETALKAWHFQRPGGLQAVSPTASSGDISGLIDAVWSKLERHADVQIRSAMVPAGPAQNATSRGADEDSDSQRHNRRIFTTPSRTWRTVTGHDRNHGLLPPLQFVILSIIAAHGPQGILQPDMNRLAKQDKRSVPKRTDDLATKGYIIKQRVIVGQGNQTCMLKLRRYTTGEISGPQHVEAYPHPAGWKDGNILYFDDWFNDLVRMTKQNDGIITTEDLRIGLDIHPQPRVRKTFNKCVERLVKTGLLRRLKAKIEGQTDQSSGGGWVNCLHLLREPTEADRDAFSDSFDWLRSGKKPKRVEHTAQEPHVRAVQSDEDSESSDDLGSDSDDDEDDAEPSSETPAYETSYSLRSHNKATKLVHVEQISDDESSQADHFTPSPKPIYNNKTQPQVALNSPDISTISTDDYIMAISSSACGDWGFTRLHSRVLMDQDGHRALLGSQAAARNPLRLINRDDSGDQAWIDRIFAEAQAKKSPRSEPGVYIDPTDAVEKAKIVRYPKGPGRKPRLMIAVFKSERLKELGWFKNAKRTSPTANTAPVAARGKSHGRSAEDNYQPPQLEAQQSTLNQTLESTNGGTSATGPTHATLDLLSSFDSAPAFSTRRARKGFNPTTDFGTPTNVTVPKETTTPDPPQHFSTPTAVHDTGLPNSDSISSSKRKRKRKLDQLPALDLGQNKRSRSGASLIARLPVPRSAFMHLDNPSSGASTFIVGSGVEPKNGYPGGKRDTLNEDRTDRDATPIPSVLMSPDPALGVILPATTQGVADKNGNYSKAYTLQHPEIEWRHRGHGRYAPAPVAEPSQPLPGNEGTTDLHYPTLDAEKSIYQGSGQPPKYVAVEPSYHDLRTASRFVDKKRFPPAPGITVRRTAVGLATLSNETLLDKNDSLEIWKKHHKSQAKPLGYTQKVDTSYKSAVLARDHQRRLLMYPCQISHEASGTIGTLSVMNDAFTRFVSVQTLWKKYQIAPNYLPDFLARAELLGYAKDHTLNVPDERFDSELECVRALERSAESDARLLNFDTGPVFINHGLDDNSLPWSTYALRVEADDFFPRYPPFHEDFHPRNMMRPLSSPKTDPLSTPTQRNNSQRRRSRRSDSVSAADVNLSSSPSTRGPRHSLSTAQLLRPNSVSQPALFSANPLIFARTPAQNFYQGLSLSLGPMLSWATYGAPTAPSPTPLFARDVPALPTPDPSNGSVGSSSRTSADVEERRKSQSSADLGNPECPSNPRRPSEANSNKESCSTCKKNGRTCYGGSKTTRCSFCAKTGSLCSRVDQSKSLIAAEVEREELAAARRPEQSPPRSDPQRAAANNALTPLLPKTLQQVQSGLFQRPPLTAWPQPITSSASSSVFSPHTPLPASAKAAAANIAPPPVVTAITQQPKLHPQSKATMCERCVTLRKRECIGGSATERCASCLRQRSLCSKNDADREKLINWGRLTGQYAIDAARAPSISAQSNLPSEKPPTNQPQSVVQSVDLTQSASTGKKRKRAYTYKANQAAKDAVDGNVDEPFDRIFRVNPNEPVDSSRSPSVRLDEPRPSKRFKAAPFPDGQRLCIAVALFNMLCRGQGDRAVINWDVVAHALAFKYDKSMLRNRWGVERPLNRDFNAKLRQALGDAFLKAYESGDAPVVDFNNLTGTDWPALVRWVEDTILPLDNEGNQSLEDLPVSREDLQHNFEISGPSEETEKQKQMTTMRAVSDNKTVILAKSYIRAINMTHDDIYDSDAAVKILKTLDAATLTEAVEQLKRSHTIQRKKTGRQLPGRNYAIHKDALSQFARWQSSSDDFMFLRSVAEARTRFVKHFSEHERSTISPEASEADRIVITNMVAQGHLKMTATLPHLDNDMLQKIQKDATLSFPVEYSRTSTFTSEHNLRSNISIPRETPPPLADAVPFWIDIHGNLLDEVWDMVLRSVLHALVFHPCSTARGIEKAHQGHLWVWEIEMVLHWMEKVGVAQRCGSAEMTGWRATEWWYLLFSDEVATWKAPDGALGEDE